jgi:hypothetical protein
LWAGGVQAPSVSTDYERQTMQTKRTQRDFDLAPLDGNPRQLRVVRQMEVTGPEPWEMPARVTPSATSAHVEGSYTDRAKGFSISTWQLSGIFGLSVWVVSGLGGTAMFSLLGLAWLVGAFSLVWLAAFILHTFVSAEGTELFRAASEYRLLREEQKERHRRYRSGQ